MFHVYAKEDLGYFDTEIDNLSYKSFIQKPK